MAGTIVNNPVVQFFDNNGNPLVGGKIITYLSNTTTPASTWQNEALSTLNTNPIVLNSRGEATIWLTPDIQYTFVVTDANDNLIQTINDIYGGFQASNGVDASQVTYTPAGSGAVATTVQDALRKSQLQVINVEDAPFYAVGDGFTDDTQAFADAMAYIVSLGGGTLELVSTSTYLLNGGTAQPDGYKNGILIPMGSVNADPNESIMIEGNGARLVCGSDDMILIRNSRNCTTLRNMTLDYNSRNNVYLCLTGPEDMTQTVTLTSNSLATIDNVNRIGGAGCDGLVFMPGPNVGGADSGAFYHNVIGGYSNFVGGGRHIWAKKNVDWATHPNWITRSNFIGQRLTRGNVGYHFEDGSEITLQGCNEEAIANGTTPLATPTARQFESPCSNIQFFGGFSEACTLAVFLDTNGVVESWGYKPASGSDSTFITFAQSWADGVSDDRPWTPVITSSGGGSAGLNQSVGRAVKQGKIVFITAQVFVDKGTLGAGSVFLSGLPYVGDPTWTDIDFQGIPCTKTDGIDLGVGNVALVGSVTGAGMILRKISGVGTAMNPLAVADCASTIIFTLQGWYKAV